MNKMAGIIIMCLGAVLLVAGFLIYRKAMQPIPLTQEEINKQKGDAFEAFVVKKFDDKYFKLKEWASDKMVDGIYPESNQYPDLVYDFIYKDNTYPLAIECKYRQSYFNGGIKFSYPDQLKRYKSFEKEKVIPVFVVIGVGGRPDSPGDLFIIPLNKLDDVSIDQASLKEYYKEPQKPFFFDSKRGVLK